MPLDVIVTLYLLGMAYVSYLVFSDLKVTDKWSYIPLFALLLVWPIPLAVAVWAYFRGVHVAPRRISQMSK